MSLNRARAEQPASEVAASAVLVGQAHLGAGALLAQGVVLRSRQGSVRLGNHSDETVLVGGPPHVLRAATDADRARLAALRGGQVNLTHHLGTTVHTPPVAGVRMGRLYAYRDKDPASPTPRCCSTPPKSPATSSSVTARSSAPA
jgi:hypothetical protein